MTGWRLYTERALIGAVALLLLAYGLDFAIFKMRGQPRNTLEVRQFLAVPLKGSKTEFDYQGSIQTACVRSLFPQSGLAPCWYLNRHRTLTITP